MESSEGMVVRVKTPFTVRKPTMAPRIQAAKVSNLTAGSWLSTVSW